jgi:hypothetical protein
VWPVDRTGGSDTIRRWLQKQENRLRKGSPTLGADGRVRNWRAEASYVLATDKLDLWGWRYRLGVRELKRPSGRPERQEDKMLTEIGARELEDPRSASGTALLIDSRIK